MNRKILGFLTAALMTGPMAANAQYVYTYTGPDFDLFGPADMPGNPYTTADHLTLRLTTSTPLPANLVVGSSPTGFPGVAFVSLTASDGVNSDTYTASDITHPGQLPLTTQINGFVTTNSAGMITNSFIYGQTVSTTTNYFQWLSDHGRDDAFTAPQATAPAFFASAGYASPEGNGTWTFSPEIDPTSAASDLTLLLSALAMALGSRRSLSPEGRKRRSFAVG
jgi:hypothetical protein